MLKKRYRSAKQVEAVIDLERLRPAPKKCIERDPFQFLDFTFPLWTALDQDLKAGCNPNHFPSLDELRSTLTDDRATIVRPLAFSISPWRDKHNGMSDTLVGPETYGIK